MFERMLRVATPSSPSLRTQNQNTEMCGKNFCIKHKVPGPRTIVGQLSLSLRWSTTSRRLRSAWALPQSIATMGG